MRRRHCILLNLTLLLSCRESSDLTSQTIITGAWTSACLPSEGSNKTSQIRYNFGDNHTVVRKQVFYSDGSCGDAEGEISHRGAYSLEVRTEVSVYNIDMFFSDVRATPLSIAGVSDWRAQGFCGTADWELNLAKNISGLKAAECLSFGTKRIEYRDLVELTPDQRLSFASTLSNLTPRPSAMPPTNPLGDFSRDSP